jgi:hypothetical protein
VEGVGGQQARGRAEGEAEGEQPTDALEVLGVAEDLSEREEQAVAQAVQELGKEGQEEEPGVVKVLSEEGLETAEARGVQEVEVPPIHYLAAHVYVGEQVEEEALSSFRHLLQVPLHSSVRRVQSP